MSILKHKTRHALLMSLTSLMLCVSMLVGATFAWFTDSVTSGVNRIVSGNLDVELLHINTDVATATSVESDTLLFNAAADEGTILWEPGAASYETFTVQNKGTLNLKYQFAVNNLGNNTMKDDTTKSLLNAIRVGVAEGSDVATIKSAITTTSKTLGDLISGTDYTSFFVGSLTPAEAEKTFTVVLYWPQSADDNNWNPETTDLANKVYKTSDGKQLWVDLGITLVATQATGEYDSFGSNYDETAAQPTVSTASATATVTAGEATTLTAAVAPAESSTTSVEFPANALTGESVSMTVSTTDAANTAAKFQITDTTNGAAIGSVSFDFGTATTNFNDDSSSTAIVTTYIATGLTQANLKVRNTTENIDATIVSYDDETGKLVFTTTHFSDFVIYDSTAVAAVGNNVYTSLANAINAAANGETVALLKDTTETVTIAAGQDITLDLNGKKLTNDKTNTSGYAQNSTIKNFGTLTIEGNGMVNNVTNNAAALYNGVNATATLNGGKYTRSKEDGWATPNTFYVICNHGDMTINNGVDITSISPYVSSMIEVGYQNSGIKTECENFSSVSAGNKGYPKLTINGGAFAGKYNLVKDDDYATVVINGGTFDIEGNYAVQSTNNVTINGGTFKSTGAMFYLSGNPGSDSNKGVISIKGGTFTAGGNLFVVGDGKNPTVAISGGTFSSTIDSSYLAEGYTLSGESAPYTVVAPSAE